MATKIKTWADKFEMTPTDHAWSRITNRMDKNQMHSRIRPLKNILTRVAAILIFVWVSITLIKEYSIDSQSNVNNQNESFQISGIDLNDVSVYCNHAQIRELKIAYHKLGLK